MIVETVARSNRVGRTLLLDSRRFGPERLREFEESLRPGGALLSYWHTNRDLYELERDTVLRRSWHYAAHVGELSAVGDQIIQKIVGVPIVLLRNEQNEIGGFINICRHRAHLVVLENQNQRSMQCLYHGWTYGLDGCLRAAPRSRTDPRFDEEAFPLRPVQVHQWGPTLWVNLDLDAPQPDSWGSPALEDEGVKVGDYRYAFDKTRTLNANWKVLLDSAIARYPSRETAPDLHRPDLHRPDLHRPDGVYHWIYPVNFLRFSPDQRAFDIASIRVHDVDRIAFQTIVFVRNDMAGESEDRLRNSYEDDPAVDEIVGACARVHETLAARPARPGPLLPGSEQVLLRLRQTLRAMTLEASGGET